MDGIALCTDGVALASVISTGAVAAASLIINAITKRGDRKHEASIEFEKRVWDIKSHALLSVIKICESIHTAVRIHSGMDVDRVRAAVYREFHRANFRLLTPELLAYAAESVTYEVEKLQRAMQRVLLTDALLYEIQVDEARKEKELAIDEGDFDRAANVHNREVAMDMRLGKSSEIDVNTVSSLCKATILHARNDLRGGLAK